MRAFMMSTDLDEGGQPEGKLGNYSVCCCFTRKFKMTKADPPSDVKKAFENYSDDGIHMNDDQLRRFIEECQGGDGGAVLEDESIVEQVHHRKHQFTSRIHRRTFTLEDFHYYLFNSDLNPPIRSQVHQDMNLPLSHYFIYTGHNSYLTGNQLSSRSSDTPIIKALKRGVRVIELDLWPSKDNVKVVHGRTLTKPVKLIRCLKSIKEHAFIASPYPVIITLEDHLTPDLQAKVAKMVKDTFGDMLFCHKSGKHNEFPTPESLKRRILISTKPPKEYLEAGEEEDKCTKSHKTKDSAQNDIWGEEPSSAIAYKDKSDKLESDHNHNTEDYDVKNYDSSLAYKDLIAIHAGKPKGGLVEALKIEKDTVRRLSLSEQTLEKAARNHQQQLVRFTQNNILRIYPKGTRFTSTNYKPLVGWLHGAQMIAFNMQGYGRWLWLMHGMFRANGGCGYVKKPDFLMTKGANNEVFDPRAELPVKITLKVKVYMGDGWLRDFKLTHFDSCSPPDFYTRVGISGAPADEIMEKTMTKQDTWSPVWNEEFIFPLRLPEIALLRIEVHEYDVSENDDFGGQTCLPVLELRTGIRAVPLCSRKGDQYTGARLLMRFELS